MNKVARKVERLRTEHAAPRFTVVGDPRVPLGAALLVNADQTTVRRADLLAALNLPANARLQFGGREWLQDFDDEACLIVTVPR